MEDSFGINEASQRKLIIEMLIRITVENSMMRDYIRHNLSMGNEDAYEALEQTFVRRYQERDKELRESIFAEYGLDFGPVLPPKS